MGCKYQSHVLLALTSHSKGHVLVTFAVKAFFKLSYILYICMNRIKSNHFFNNIYIFFTYPYDKQHGWHSTMPPLTPTKANNKLHKSPLYRHNQRQKKRREVNLLYNFSYMKLQTPHQQNSNTMKKYLFLCLLINYRV